MSAAIVILGVAWSCGVLNICLPQLHLQTLHPQVKQSTSLIAYPPFISAMAFIARLIPFLKHIKTSMSLTFPTWFPIQDVQDTNYPFNFSLQVRETIVGSEYQRLDQSPFSKGE